MDRLHKTIRFIEQILRREYIKNRKGHKGYANGFEGLAIELNI